MFDMLPIVLPAALVVVVAAVLVRREHAEQVIDLTDWDDVPIVPVFDSHGMRPPRTGISGGALVEPCAATLGDRMRAAQPEQAAQGRVRVRRRARPLVAARSD